ncbi:MAG: methionyl-tRNA formyltransferase [bacterium]|nr:methionyl-tRNA formyltransferase [bacterium]
MAQKSTKQMRILFMGSPDFALPSLKQLVNSEDQIIGVVTQPDRSAGRGHHLSPPAVKEFALTLGLPIRQFTSLKTDEAVRTIKELAPDLIVVVAYGKILPEELLAIPPYGCLNLHASLLPEYRGAAPINRAIINGETITGVTTMWMDEGLDTGDIILQSEVEIAFEETAGELGTQLSRKGAELLGETIKLIKQGKAPRKKQDQDRASFASPIKKEEGLIEWHLPAIRIHNLVRGLNPVPGAYTYWQGKRLKVWRTLPSMLSQKTSGAVPGEVVSLYPEKQIIITCGKGQSIYLIELQMPGKRRLSAFEFLRGHKIQPGYILGEIYSARS